MSKHVSLNGVEQLISDEDYRYYLKQQKENPHLEVKLLLKEDLTNRPNMYYDVNGVAYLATKEEGEAKIKAKIWFKTPPPKPQSKPEPKLEPVTQSEVKKHGNNKKSKRDN